MADNGTKIKQGALKMGEEKTHSHTKWMTHLCWQESWKEHGGKQNCLKVFIRGWVIRTARHSYFIIIGYKMHSYGGICGATGCYSLLATVSVGRADCVQKSLEGYSLHVDGS